MGIFSLLLVIAADDPADMLAKKMLPIYVKEVESYKMAVTSAPDKPLVLKKEPVFEWSNPARSGGQQGAVFLWLRDGRPAALGCIFSEPYRQLPPGRKVTHELHALDPEKLLITREGLNKWNPQEGLARIELPDAPTPADTPAGRLIQLRRLAQEFSGYSVDSDGKQWDLRLLSTPLFRYPAAKTGVVDGALFALVSNAGTDPEVLLLIEARENRGKLQWEFVCGRFSDWDLHVKRKDKEVFSSIRSETNPVQHNPNHTYRVYPEKVITPDGKLLARVKQTPEIWWGEVIPVEDK